MSSMPAGRPFSLARHKPTRLAAKVVAVIGFDFEPRKHTEKHGQGQSRFGHENTKAQAPSLVAGMSGYAALTRPTIIGQAMSPARTSPTRPIPLVQAVKTGAIPETSRPLLSAADGRRRDGGGLHGNSCAVGSPFLWLLSFGEAKESSPPPRGKRQIKNIRAADTADKTRLAANPLRLAANLFMQSR